MSAGCCATEARPDGPNDPRWRRVLWVALAVNAAMFVVELIAGLTADSRALQADALDFLGDAANYAISLGVAGLALAWRARAAIAKAVTMLLFGLWVLATSLWDAWVGSAPDAGTMGVIGTIALAANVLVTILLFRFREGDANMRSVWICSRNDAIANLAVLAAALGVIGTGQAWPDLIVAAVIAGLAVSGSAQVFGQARGELRSLAISR